MIPPLPIILLSIYLSTSIKINDLNRAFMLENYMIGPKHFRRLVQKTNLDKCRHLERAQSEHRLLEFKLRELDTVVRSHSSQAEYEIKILKAQKLRLKDLMVRLSKEAVETAPPASVTLGQGGFGKVICGVCLSNQKEVAIKIASKDDYAMLMKEYKMLQRLSYEVGFPRPHYFGTQELLNTGSKHVVMVMDVLGPSLERLLFATTLGVRGFSSLTVLRLASQMICRLEALSRYKISHGDIHPANFLMGTDAASNHTVSLIDFGLASMRTGDETTTITVSANRTYASVHDQANIHSIGLNVSTDVLLCRTDRIAEPTPTEFVGTAAFASSNILRGGRGTACDDLESLVYSLAYLLTSRLPWSDLESDCASTTRRTLAPTLASSFEKLAAMKDASNDLCPLGLAMEGDEIGYDAARRTIGDMLAYVRSLRGINREGSPNYQIVHEMINVATVAAKSAPSSTFSSAVFDWEREGIRWSPIDGAITHEKY